MTKSAYRRKRVVEGLLTASEGQSMITMAGSVLAGSQGRLQEDWAGHDHVKP